MKYRISIITLLFCFFYGCIQKQDYGKAVITDFHYGYDSAQQFAIAQQLTDDVDRQARLLYEFTNSFENGSSEFYMGPPLQIINNGTSIRIDFSKGGLYDGYTWMFEIESDLSISATSFNIYDHTEDGSETTFVVEKVILELDKNPFTDSLFAGKYTLQVRHEFTAGEVLEEFGIEDSISHSILFGKFRNY